jgi:predicted nucleic acid-binding protein
MIVLDANILIRAVLGKRVRQLLETYSDHGIRFYRRKLRMPMQRSICPLS